MAMETFTPGADDVVHSTRVDFILRPVQDVIHIVQYDKGLPIIEVELYRDGLPYTLPADANVWLRWGTKDHVYMRKLVMVSTDRKKVYFRVTYSMAYFDGVVNPLLVLEFADGKCGGSSIIPVTIDRDPIQYPDGPAAPEDEILEEIRNYASEAGQDVIDARAARDAAIGAKNDAVDAKDAAVNAKNAAVSAKNDAVDAKDAAVSAKNDAVSAKNDAVDAKTAAVSAKNDAVSAKNDAVDAKTAAVSAKNDAVDAKDAAVNAKNAAVSAKNDAVDAKTAAEAAAAEAAQIVGDKANMEAIAPLYDPSKAYVAGERCMYLGKFYEWIENATAGTLPTNTTYAKERSVDELINEIENGGIEVSQAKSARNINPLSDESGATQSEPFISQGTGTNNNLASVDTGTFARLLKKQGNTMVVNQFEPDPTFASSARWSTGGGTVSIADNIATFTATQANGSLRDNALKFISGHKYYLYSWIKETTATNLVYIAFYDGLSVHTVAAKSTTEWQLVKGIVTATNSTSSGQLQPIRDGRLSGWDAIQCKKCGIIDLTQWFNGNNNIPVDLLSDPSHFSWYYNGSMAYDAGSLKNCDGVTLWCGQERNLCDEVLEGGGINASGEETSSNDTFRTENFSLIIPNRAYHLHFNTSLSASSAAVYEYDKDYNFISYSSISNNDTFTASANTWFVKFTFYKSSSGWGTNPPAKATAQITLSLYYPPEQGGEGYDQYYPYVAPKSYNTGTEKLLFLDTKDPDGTWHKNSVSKKFSELSFTKDSTYNIYIAVLTGAPNTGIKTRTSKYTRENYAGDASLSDKAFYCANGRIYIKDNSYTDASTFATANANVEIQYNLTTPTTEQGTPFDANIEVSDYNMMWWTDEDGNLVGIPQGVTIQYPPSYVDSIDTLFSYLEGDMTDIVRKSDIATQEEIDEILAIV